MDAWGVPGAGRWVERVVWGWSSGALGWGPLEVLQAKYPGGSAAIAPLPDPSITQPNLVIKPHRDAQPAGQGTGAIANPKEI